jgi:hypothetical protein
VVTFNFSSPNCIVSVSSSASSLPITHFCYRFLLRSMSLTFAFSYYCS